MTQPDSNDVVPIVLSFLVCDRVILDAQTSQPSIIGIVTSVQASKFPVQSPPLAFFAELTSGHGLAPLVLRVVDANEERPPVLEVELSVEMGDPLAITSLTLGVGSLVFPEPGVIGSKCTARGSTLWSAGS